MSFISKPLEHMPIILKRDRTYSNCHSLYINLEIIQNSKGCTQDCCICWLLLYTVSPLLQSVHSIFVCIGNLFHFRTLVIKILFFELQMSRKSL